MSKDEKGKQEKQEEEKVVKRASVAVFLLVLVLFAVIIFFTYFVEAKLGKAAGIGSLVIITILVAGYLYKEEIKEKIRRYKK